MLSTLKRIVIVVASVLFLAMTATAANNAEELARFYVRSEKRGAAHLGTDKYSRFEPSTRRRLHVLLAGWRHRRGDSDRRGRERYWSRLDLLATGGTAFCFPAG